MPASNFRIAELRKWFRYFFCDKKEKSPLHKSIKNKKLVKSAVFTKGGYKFVVIGASPFDSYISVKDENVQPKNLNETINAINK